jgi:hypothetical protein
MNSVVSFIKHHCFRTQLRSFFTGAYVSGMVITFAVTAFGCALGGHDADLWRPFVYAPFWPVVVIAVIVSWF